MKYYMTVLLLARLYCEASVLPKTYLAARSLIKRDADIIQTLPIELPHLPEAEGHLPIEFSSPANEEGEDLIELPWLPEEDGSINTFLSAGSCPVSHEGDDWVHFDGFCYLFKTHAFVKWSRAQHECQSLNSELASIHSDAESQFIHSQVVRPFISGRADPWLWIGLKKGSNSRTFTWTDGSDTGYTNWNGGEPSYTDSYGRDENCVELYFDNSRWNDVNCHARRGFICKVAHGGSIRRDP